MHRMQILASFESPRFRSEGRHCLLPRRVPVPAPASPPTAPISVTIARDGLWSWATLTYAGERVFMRHHNMWVSAFGPGTWLAGVFDPQNGRNAGCWLWTSQNLPSTHSGE
jgi:hypothetical protein